MPFPACRLNGERPNGAVPLRRVVRRAFRNAAKRIVRSSLAAHPDTAPRACVYSAENVRET